MKEKPIDLNALEMVDVKISSKAFKPEILHCSLCNKKMKKNLLEVEIDAELYLRLEGFECPQCHKKYLGLEEAKKLDKAFIFKRAIGRDFKMERNLSFDGDNYTFRIPKEFTQQIHKRKIEITPLGATEFCASVE